METRGLGWLHTAQFQQFHSSGSQETLVCHQFGGIYCVLKTNHWTAADWGAWINRPQWTLNEYYLSYFWPRWLKSTSASDTYVTFALSDTKYVNLVIWWWGPPLKPTKAKVANHCFTADNRKINVHLSSAAKGGKKKALRMALFGEGVEGPYIKMFKQRNVLKLAPHLINNLKGCDLNLLVSQSVLSNSSYS